MFAFMARTARTGSNATSRLPSASKYLYSERELQSLAKGFANLEQQGVKRACDFQQLLPELWNHERNYNGRDSSWQGAIASLAKVPGLSTKRRAEPARFVEPMQCLPVAKLPEGPNWEYEVKFDGYRALGIIPSRWARNARSIHI
jgi:ATP-dependent DNA ligase